MSEVVITLDPGHGGTDPGACANGYREKDITLQIALKVRDKLRVKGIRVVMTRETDVSVELSKRVQISDAAKTTRFISIHVNAGRGKGAEVLCYLSGGEGQELAQYIADQVCNIMGVHGSKLKDGSWTYVVKNTDAPACLVEVGFIDSDDINKIIANIDNLAEVIYVGIINDLVTNKLISVQNTIPVPQPKPQPIEIPQSGFPLPLSSTPSVVYQSHVEGIGWSNLVCNGDVCGTEGKSLRLEGLRIELENAPQGARIKTEVHVENIGWMNSVYDGAFAGTTGKSLRLEAIKIRLEGLDDYSVCYQVHCQNLGWQDWKSNGEIAGTVGQSLRIEALRIKLVKK